MKLVSLFLLMLFPYMVYAQANYVFPEFITGEIYYKENVISASLNYNLFLSDMLIIDDNKKKRLTNIDKIEYIRVGHKKFIPINDNTFGEIVVDGELTLAVKYSGQIVKTDENVKNVSKMSLNKMLDSGNSLPEGITVKTDSAYYLIKQRNEQKMFYLPGTNVAKATYAGITRLFSKHKEEINSFIETNKTDFSSSESLKQLVEFCEKYTD